MRSPLIYFSAGIIWGLSLAYLLIGYFKDTFSTSTQSVKIFPVKAEAVTVYPDHNKLEEMINDYRVEKKTKPLKHDEYLCKWAEKRAEEIKTDYSHDKAELYSTTILKHGYVIFGENLCIVGPNQKEDSALLSWKMSKDGHNEAMLDARYTNTCVRCLDVHCVQLFAGK